LCAPWNYPYADGDTDRNAYGYSDKHTNRDTDRNADGNSDDYGDSARRR
jgi:hypothetical protein